MAFGDVSTELCGGTHVGRTGEIGQFVTLGESASASGVRRIEALTGAAAEAYLAEQDHNVAEIALALKAQRGEVVDRVRALMDERKSLQSEVAELRKQLALAGGGASEAPAIASSSSSPARMRTSAPASRAIGSKVSSVKRTRAPESRTM